MGPPESGKTIISRTLPDSTIHVHQFGTTTAGAVQSNLPDPPFRFAADSSYLYWMTGKAVLRSALSGGAVSTVVTFSGTPLIDQLVADGKNVYINGAASGGTGSLMYAQRLACCSANPM